MYEESTLEISQCIGEDMRAHDAKSAKFVRAEG